jgi:hypothetical protein
VLQAITKGLGGAIETSFPSPPGATTVSLYNAGGTARVDAQACTVDSVATTLSAAAAAEDDTLSVVSASGIAVNRRYLVGGSSEAAEVITVKSISGTTITPWAPLMFAHASGVSFVGLRVTYSVSSSAADTYWFDGYAVFSPTTGEPQVETVECVRRKIVDNLIDMSDVRGVMPKAPKALSEELDIPAALRAARDELLLDIGGKNRVYTMLGTDQFRRPAAIKFWLMRRFEFGEEEWGQAFDALEREYDRLKERIISQTVIDADQDGATNGPDDFASTAIRLERS